MPNRARAHASAWSDTGHRDLGIRAGLKICPHVRQRQYTSSAPIALLVVVTWLERQNGHVGDVTAIATRGEISDDVFQIMAWPLAGWVRNPSHPGVDLSERRRQRARCTPQPLPSAPWSWRGGSPTGVACSRPSVAGREVPRRRRTRTRSYVRGGRSFRTSRQQRQWLRMRRPAERDRPEMSTRVTFVPGERTVGACGRNQDRLSIAARTGGWWMVERSRTARVG